MPDIGGAVVNGDFVLVKQLLDDISTGSKKSINEIVDGSSLLHLAIGTKQVCMPPRSYQLLNPSWFRQTVFHHFLSYNVLQTHITSLLLRNGADPDLMDTFGYAVSVAN